jgi:hypothetical protein
MIIYYHQFRGVYVLCENFALVNIFKHPNRFEQKRVRTLEYRISSEVFLSS